MTSATCSKTLLIVDPSVQDYRSLTDHLSAEADVLILDANRDGIEQITEALADRRSIQSLHVLSHGSPGTLYLGTAQLSWETLSRYAEQVSRWINSFTNHAEILLYGCEVAAGQFGQLFIQQLSHLSGASIAASTNRTGSAALGGDWTLESTVGAILSPSIFSPTAMADFQSVLAPVVFVNETFTRSDVTPGTAFWTSGIGGDAGDETSPAVAPYLTARPVATANPVQVSPNGGGLPGNPTEVLDADGAGVLRLTNDTFDQAGFVLYNQPINSNAGLSITFDMFQWGGTSRNGLAPGGDGISFFLIDGNTPYSDQAGAFGGSLGYAQKTVPGPIPGVAGGYLGVGFDAFGNYSNGGEGRVGGAAGTGPTTLLPNTVAVRGSAATGYQYLTGTTIDPANYTLNALGATTRAPAARKVQITLTGDGILNVAIDANNDNDFLDPQEAVITNYNTRAAGNGEVPDFFKFGFAAGTGDSTANHEVRNLVVTTLDSPPDTNSAKVNLPINSTVNLTRAGGADADLGGTDAAPGSVTGFRILTLPTPDQGTLFLGDPAANVRVTVGQTLTPAQIGQIFFQSSGTFTGSSFTYTAIDNFGSESLTPGVVTLGLTNTTTPPGSGNPQPPDTIPQTFELPQNTLANLPGLGGTDPNPEDTITSFTILTVPDSTQGTLYLGLPSADGKVITPGQVIPAADIGQLFFQSSINFNAPASFTYAATDNTGRTDLTPATVTINFSNFLDPVGCKPGVNLKGNRRNNRITGTGDRDQLAGRRGNDRLIGEGCSDRLRGNRGNDRLVGGTAGDRLLGQQNNDEMRGNNGIDFLDGGLGNDRAYGGRGRDTVMGRRGDDMLQGRNGDDRIMGGRGKDRIMGGTNLDILEGEQNDDVIFGQKGIDFINGGLGSDRAVGGQKTDTVYGRRGDDRLRGNGDVDLLLGNRGNDRLLGGSQADRILGGLGRDVIIAGGGLDVLSGGGGRDTYLYRSAKLGTDRILDFKPEDRIDLKGIFRGPDYGSSNPFKDYVRLSAGSGGTVVRVDANGDKAGGFVRLAILEGVAPSDLSANNFIVG